MENLNAEQVKKALECWANNEPCNGEGCPYFENYQGFCGKPLAIDALALITSQEQRIKELDDDNARLYYICQSYALQYGTATDKEVFLKKERADTVRKMQERAKERLPQLLIDSSYLDVLDEEHWVLAADQLFERISQIAKEMME